jgi:addiction module HigA family antidote
MWRATSVNGRAVNATGLGFHALTEGLAGRYSVTVSRETGASRLHGTAKTQRKSIERTSMARTLCHPSIEPAQPGELLAEITIPATGKSNAEIARLLGISRQTLYDILSRKHGVSPSVAVRLGKLFGDGPEIWLRMQTEHDLWHARKETDVSSMKTLEDAA